MTTEQKENGRRLVYIAVQKIVLACLKAKRDGKTESQIFEIARNEFDNAYSWVKSLEKMFGIEGKVKDYMIINRAQKHINFILGNRKFVFYTRYDAVNRVQYQNYDWF